MLRLFVTLGHKPVPPLPRSASPEPPSASLPQETRKSNHSRTYGPFACNFNYSRTYEIPRGWGVLVIPIFSRRALRTRRSLARRSFSRGIGPARRSFSEGGPLLASPLFPLDAKTTLVCLLFPLLTQKRGEEVFLAKNLFGRLACFGHSLRNVGAPTFLIFPLIFRTSLPLACPP